MSTLYVVKQGDTLSKIALAYHLPSYKTYMTIRKTKHSKQNTRIRILSLLVMY